MASFAFDSVMRYVLLSNIDFYSDTFYVMLTTSDYSPDKKTHSKRSDVTNEVSGVGYSASGTEVAVTVTEDFANDRIDISLGGATWPDSTITARGAEYYKSRGGLASDDELVAYIDFGANKTSSNGSFELTSSILRISIPA